MVPETPTVALLIKSTQLSFLSAPQAHFFCDKVSVSAGHGTGLPPALQWPASFSLSLPLPSSPSPRNSDPTQLRKPLLTTQFTFSLPSTPSSPLAHPGTLNLLCLALLFLFFFPSAPLSLLISHKFKLWILCMVSYLSLSEYKHHMGVRIFLILDHWTIQSSCWIFYMISSNWFAL